MGEGRLPFEYEVAAVGDNVTAWGGLPLVVETMTAFGVDSAVRKYMRLLRGRRQFDELDFARALVLLHTAGGDCVDDLRPLRDDQALAGLLGRVLPAPETVLQFLYLFHEERLIDAAKQSLPPDRKAYVPQESAALRGLANVVTNLVAQVQRRFPVDEATLDIDATFQESHKKEAKEHYEGGPGYQPILATWVEQKVVVYDEFRDGNVPPQQDALGVAQRSFAALPPGIKKRKMRADSAMYSIPLLRWCCSEEQNIEFAIGAQMREGLRETCLAVPEQAWAHVDTRPDSVVHIAEVDYAPKGWRVTEPKLRYFSVRITPIQSDLFDAARTVQHLAVVSNAKGDASDIVRWYWGKGGTIEHVHGVLKNELGAGVLPCGRFGANAAWFRFAVLAFNLLRVVRSIGPRELADARPKRLRLHLFAVPAVLATHARKLMAKIAARAQQLPATRAILWQVATAPA